MRLHLPDVEAMDVLGQRLAAVLPTPAVVHLRGDLGAGKSTLARALLRALGVQGPIRSPTYTLVERYPLPGGEAWHLDLYRIGHAAELDFLGLDEAQVLLWLVEWPEKAPTGLPAADLIVDLVAEDQGRQVSLAPGSPAGAAWLAALHAEPQLHGFAGAVGQEGAAGTG